MAKEVKTFSDIPYAFFGHSMGAIVAYEVARQLITGSGNQIKHLFLSARAAPDLQDNNDPLRFLDDEIFIDRLHQTYGAVPEAIRQSAELREVFLPILRADVELLEKYKEVMSEPLDCPISVFGGKSDPAISKGMLSGWRTRTNAVFMQHEFPGEHFYLNLEREAVIKTILNDLTHCL
jgi:surfactin synthase thioesterase subunit